jgi:hypothetical protein
MGLNKAPHLQKRWRLMQVSVEEGIPDNMAQSLGVTLFLHMPTKGQLVTSSITHQDHTMPTFLQYTQLFHTSHPRS